MAAVALAAPGDPFGGDDPGCAPDTKTSLKCSNGALSAVCKAWKAVIKCHVKQADAAFKGAPADDEPCEKGPTGKSALEKLNASLGKLSAAGVCVGSAANVIANANMVRDQLFNDSASGSIDMMNASVYCDPGTAIDPGGDDPGTVDTTSKDKLKCADTVNKSLAKLLASVCKCHVKAATALLSSKPFDEENTCEETNAGKGAHEKYTAAMTKIDPICTQGCLSSANRAALATSLISTIESFNNKFYPCAGATTTTTTTSTTTTTAVGSCAPIVTGQPGISGVYKTVTLPSSDPIAIKLCTTNATDATKRFGPCTTDASCGAGSAAGVCAQTPWVDAGGVTQATGTATTTFTVCAGTFPTCEHTVSIVCGSTGKCADIQGGCDMCGGAGPACTPSSPNMICPITDQCCQSPGFTLEALLIGPGTLNFCTRVDQTACGFGVVNTSNPQTGDNDVNREADTSDPGADCQYGTPDDPTGKACSQFGTGQGNDTKGLVRVSKGNGAADASGIQIRYLTPGVATTWADGGGCPATATFDNGESIISQLPQAAEPSTAGASGAYVDLNKDGCRRVGAGYTNLPSPPQDNAAAGVPYRVVGGPAGSATAAATAMAYGGGKFRMVTMGAAFSGANPLFDVGFAAITPTGAPTFQAAGGSCTCPAVHTCPECDAGSAGCPTCKGTGATCAAGSECCSNTCTTSICQ